MHELRVFAIGIIVSAGFAGSTFAQAPNFAAPNDLLQRLEATERRLQATERELAELRTFLPAPSAARPIHSVGYPHGEPACLDCGKAAAGPHFCKNGGGFGYKSNGWSVVPFGKLELETVFATDTAVSENYIVFAAVRGSTKTERIDVTGQSTQVGFNISGPSVGAFQVGGLVLMDFHGNRPSRNEPGAYFIRGYGELFNDDWRIAFGQMGDPIGSWNADTVNWSGLGGLGYLGANQRGAFRVDRFLYPSDNVKWTLTGALTQPVVTDLAGFNDALGQDNGLPNFEGQIVLGLGPDCGAERPLQFSLSGLYGEYFAATFNGFPAGVSNTSEAYAIAGAMQWTGERMGFRGQVWHGRGLGTYMGGISQALNTETGETIRATGGFGQLWFNVSEYTRISAMAGIDDPFDADLSVMDNQRAQNRLVGGNIFVRLTETLQVGMDVWSVRTDYAQPASNNDIIVVFTEASLAY